MNVKTNTVRLNHQTVTFNHPERFIEGWYWAIPSHKIRNGEVKGVSILGKELVIYRGKNGKLACFDAYCPHMGAHLAKGKVEENTLRCCFHRWKFNSTGTCTEIPYLGRNIPIQLKTWHVTEKYGMVWIWTGDTQSRDTHVSSLPFIPELESGKSDVSSKPSIGVYYACGNYFQLNCHPHIAMIYTIDSHHFNTNSNLPLELILSKKQINENAIIFSNISRSREDSFWGKLINYFYKNAFTYSVCSWYGSTGVVTLGPDFLHFYIIFTLRLNAEGKTEGYSLFATKKRHGLFGWFLNPFILCFTKIIDKYLSVYRSQIFETINFNLKTPIKADHAILQFINHVEKQKTLSWENWEVFEDMSRRVKEEEENIWRSKGEGTD
ncbi:MAG: aromatic ring-hydroxylating dioxygenase subunit alpha [Cyanobacteria bacterium P01_A01_bin.84]